MDFQMTFQYTHNSLVLDSDEMRKIQSCAADNNIVVSLGYSELKGDSTYIGQCIIDNNG